MCYRCVRRRPTVALGAPVKGLAVVRFGLVRARRGRRRTPRPLIVAPTVSTTSSTTITTSTLAIDKVLALPGSFF